MLYTIRHVTRYEYPGEVRESVMEVRKHPQSNSYQRCLQFQLRTVPEVRVFQYCDHLANVVHHFDIPWNHRSLTVTAESIVDVRPPADRNNYPPDPRGSWDELAEFISNHDCCEMLQDSRYVTSAGPLEAFQQELGAQRRGTPFQLALELNQAVHHALEYDRSSSKVDSTVDEILAARKGVCQDFAHIMIASLRALGLAARYVSGYLLTQAQPGQRTLLGSDASHAWVSVYLPDLPESEGHTRWWDFDPTNQRDGCGTPGDDYVTVAWGRDYADVAPLRGMIQGGGAHTLQVAVTVTALHALG